MYNEKIYTALLHIIVLSQTKKLELQTIQWILCYGLIVTLRQSNAIISAANAKDIFNFVGNKITNVRAQTVRNGHEI